MKKVFFPVLFLIFSFSAAAQEEVVVKVDATQQIGALDPFWASQIIHPTEFLLTDWGRNFVSLLKETGAARQYIRIYNQPEKAIRVGANGEITYDWGYFDQMAELILSTGNKLEIAFFGMPLELAAYPESFRKRPYGAVVCTSPPKDYNKWEELCADFARHILKKYGERQVKEWTIRCWNEPDGSFWYKSDLEEYLKLYDYFAKAFKTISPEFKIGGPALTSTDTWKKPENFRFFLDHVTSGKNYATGQTGAPIDFIAIHTYGGSGGGPGPGRKSPEVDYMIEQQIRLANIRDEYPALSNLPIHVEEWGETSGGATGVGAKPSADIRNSEYGAAFLVNWVGRHIRLRQENDRKIDKFTFCSSGYEKIPEHDFMGYRTLDTKNGFHKPILNAYKLLNKLAPEMVKVEMSPNRNDVIAFATSDKNRITIMAVNYQAEKIDNNGPACLLNIDLVTPWKAGTNLRVEHWRIDNTHSNAYTAFKKLGSPKLPNPIDIDYIKSRMDIEQLETARKTTVKDLGDIQVTLPCNAVSLIEITKK